MCAPRKSFSRTIHEDILARPVKDTDLLLLGSAHPVPREDRWMRGQFLVRRVLNSPEQWAHLNPTAWGMLGCPAARITHGTWSSLLGPGIVVACSRKFRITDKQSICSVLCMATVSFANLCSHHGRFENLHQQNMQRVSVEITTWKWPHYTKIKTCFVIKKRNAGHPMGNARKCKTPYRHNAHNETAKSLNN